MLTALKSPSDVPASLKTFQESLLPLARKSDIASRSSTVTAEERAAHKARVDTIWSVAVPFCACCSDMDEKASFIPTVVKVMGDEKYDLLGVGCKCISSMLTTELAERMGVKILSALFNVVDKAKGDTVKVNLVCECISDAVSIGAPVQVVFKKLLPRLLTLVAPPFDADKQNSINHLLTLLSAILPGIQPSSVSAVFRATKAIINTGKCGKKAFRVLSLLLSSHPSQILESGPSEVVSLITETLMTCDVGSRHERLKSLRHVLQTLDNGSHPGVVPDSVGEILLCLKDSNGKVRDEAYSCLNAACDARGDPKDFMHILLGAVAARTPHMRSAAVMAMSRVVFERRHCEVTRGMVGEVLEVVCVLFREKAREVIKSAVGFVRVAVASMSPADLEPRLGDVVEGLLLWNSGKDRFRAKIKIILKRLVRMYGHEAVSAHVPSSDQRLITHIRKVAERERRKRQRDGGEGGDDDFEGMMDEGERDSDGGRTFMSGMTGMTRRTGVTAMSGVTGRTGRTGATAETMRTGKTGKTSQSNVTRDGKLTGGIQIKSGVVDMLDAGDGVKWVGDEEGDGFDFGGESNDDDVMEFDEAGRLVVNDGWDSDGTGGGRDDDDAPTLLDAANSAQALDKNASGESLGVHRPMKYERAQEVAASSSRKRARLDASSAPGASFKSKRSGGDVRKKGAAYEPYAYIPLDGKGYTKRHRGRTVEMMGAVVRGKGAKKKDRGAGERAGGRGRGNKRKR